MLPLTIASKVNHVIIIDFEWVVIDTVYNRIREM